MTIIIRIGIFFLKIIYFLMKLFPTQNKVTFISRQSNKPSLDFKLLEEEIKRRDKNIKIVMLTRRLKDNDSFKTKLSYSFHMLHQMFSIATSKVVIIDTYCIPVSILKHKKKLKVIQIWHAIGALKKFGYSILDKDEASKVYMDSNKLSKLMKMHKNYDYILVSSDACIEPLSEAYNEDPTKFVSIPLPRLDLLNSDNYKNQKKEEVYKKYPKLKHKKNILYAPTFRKENDTDKYLNELISKVDFKKYNLIVNLHPLSKINVTNKDVIVPTYSTLDMLIVSDYVITDYSATVYEAAFLNKPLFFYAYDIDDYEIGRDFYLDYRHDMPGIVSSDAKEIIESIEKNVYDMKQIKEFNKKYINYNSKGSSKRIIDLVIKCMKKK